MNKKRKTRTQKELSKTHDFGAPIYRVSKGASDQGEAAASDAKSTSKVDPWVIKDLKKVLTIIGLMILAVVILAAITYKTDLFTPIFSKLNIKY